MKAAKSMDRERLLLLCLPTLSVRTTITCKKGNNAQTIVDFNFSFLCRSVLEFAALFGFVILSIFFKRQIWRLWKECWRSELRVSSLGKGTAVGLWALLEREGGQICDVQREGPGRASMVSGWRRGACPVWEMEVQRQLRVCRVFVEVGVHRG
jgi:hypothetical protein